MKLTLGDTRLIIDACKKQKLSLNQAAYVLATAYHETAHKMKPIRELGGEKYLRSKEYYPYVGMGYVQLTWLKNYQKASKILDVDFVSEPKLLLKPAYSATILVVGSAEGWFTGKKLSDYIKAGKTDYVGARRIINGTDKAALIAGYAKQYEALLKADGYEGHAAPALPRADFAEIPTTEKSAFRLDTVLKIGSRGDLVEDLQQDLNALGYGPIKVDKRFGEETERAVVAFQHDNGLNVDGWAGGRTLKMIGKLMEERRAAPALAAQNVVVEAAASEGKGISKTEVVAGGTGILGAVTVADEVKQAAESAKGLYDTLWSFGPYLLVGVLIVGGAIWIYLDRRKKRVVAQAVQKAVQ